MCYNFTAWQSKLSKESYYGRHLSLQFCLSFHYTWIPWNLSFRYIHCTGQFTPKMKANAEPRLLSSLVWIDSGVVVSQLRLESFFMKWNLTEWQVSWNSSPLLLFLSFSLSVSSYIKSLLHIGLCRNRHFSSPRFLCPLLFLTSRFPLLIMRRMMSWQTTSSPFCLWRRDVFMT